MNPTRRELLAGLAAASLLPGCAWEPGPRPDAPWEPDGDLDEAAFPYGVQTGDPLEDGVVVSVHTEGAATLIVAQFTARGWQEIDELELPVDDGAARLVVEGLAADTSYAVVARAGGSRSAVARFRTVAPPGTGGVLRFGATSCLGGNRPWPSMSAVAGRDLDAFFLLGDTIYNDWGPDVGPRAKWAEALDQQGLRDVSAACPIVATWDDHEVRNNWDPERASDATLAEECLPAFRRAIPQRTGPTGGIWRKLSFGDTADVFVLDCRSERLGGRYVSDAQLAWLQGGLASSTARFKLVLNSVPITDFSWVPRYGHLEADDRWQGHPEQRGALLEHIRDVPGVLFLSGDFHAGGLLTVDAADGPGAGLHEVLCGPGGSNIHELYSMVPETERTPVMVTRWNCMLLTLRPETGQAEVVWVGDDGAAIKRETLAL